MDVVTADQLCSHSAILLSSESPQALRIEHPPAPRLGASPRPSQHPIALGQPLGGVNDAAAAAAASFPPPPPLVRRCCRLHLPPTVLLPPAAGRPRGRAATMAAAGSDDEDFHFFGTPVEDEETSRVGQHHKAVRDPAATRALPLHMQVSGAGRGAWRPGCCCAGQGVAVRSPAASQRSAGRSPAPPRAPAMAITCRR